MEGSSLNKVSSKDHGYKKLLKAWERASGKASVTVGIHEEDGGAGTSRGATVIQVANWAEFGTETSPPRPFVSSAFDATEAATAKSLQHIAEGVGTKKFTRSEGRNFLGEGLVEEYKARITASVYAPNAPRTVQLKGSAVPLVEKGLLLSSIKYKVEGI